LAADVSAAYAAGMAGPLDRSVMSGDFTKGGSKEKIEVDPLTGTPSQPAPAR
jgi:hypothetical protein